MEKVMSEFKAGELKSGGDKTVTNRKQAIAIGLAMDYNCLLYTSPSPRD